MLDNMEKKKKKSIFLYVHENLDLKFMPNQDKLQLIFL